MLIHGGFWRQRYGRELEGGIARDLVARGWAVWNIEYRRLGGGGGWPHTFEDVAAAIEALPLDGRRASSPSATRRAASSPSGPRRRAASARAVSQAGALDLDELSRLGTSDDVVNQLLGGTPEEVPHRYARASPRRRLPIGVPLLLVHGERDDDVPGPHLARVRGRRHGGRRRVRARRDRRREPLRAPRAGLALLEGGDRMAEPLTREQAAALDAADPLAGFRERFVITRPERIYLDGNSLGRLPRRHPRAGARRRSTSGATGWCRAGRSGSTRPRGSATRSPRACSARGPAR